MYISYFDISPTTVAPSGTVTATINVTNAGSGTFSGTWYVRLYDDKPSSVACNTTGYDSSRTFTSGLAANGGETRQFTLNITAPTTTGTKTARVFADATCAVPETDDTDNQAGRFYTVSTASPSPSPSPSATSPTPSHTNVTCTSFKAQWTEVSGATYYDVQVLTANDLLVGLYHPTTLYYDVTGLQQGATYHWRVSGFTGSSVQVGNWSSYDFVTTLTCASPTPTPTPTPTPAPTPAPPGTYHFYGAKEALNSSEVDLGPFQSNACANCVPPGATVTLSDSTAGTTIGTPDDATDNVFDFGVRTALSAGHAARLTASGVSGFRIKMCYSLNGGPFSCPPFSFFPTDLYAPDGTSRYYEIGDPSGNINIWFYYKQVAAPTPTPTPAPSPPTNLNVSGLPSCASGNYSVTFNWTNSASNWTIDVEGSAPYGDGSFADSLWLASKTVVSGISTPGPAGFNSNLSLNHFAPGITYSWRIFYGITNTWAVGPNFSIPQCPDLKIASDPDSEIQFYTDNTYSTVKATLVYAPNDDMWVRIKTKNAGGTINTNFNIGFYLDLTSAPDQSCPAGNPAPSQTRPITAPFASGAVNDWQLLNVKAPLTGGSKLAYAFADKDCQIPEPAPSPDGEFNNIRSKSYSVSVDAWFKTTDGDAGSVGDIFLKSTPPEPVSRYLLAGGGNLTNTNPAGAPTWFLKNYNKKLVSAPPYNYLAERFRQKAIDASKTPNSESCNISAGFTSFSGSRADSRAGSRAASREGFSYCSGDAIFIPGDGPKGNSVWFIDGNMTISGDLTLDPEDSAVFIVQGSITVNTDVRQIDGIYVANGTFTDITDASSASGGQLVVNGAVLANAVSLARILGAPGCGAGPCSNATDPAEVFNFQPKYLDLLNSILGSAAISWKEVNP